MIFSTDCVPICLLYITYQENILGSGILYTQVLRMLEGMATTSRRVNIVLLSYVSPQLLWSERRGFSELRQHLQSKGVRLILLPMFFPARWRLPWSLPQVLWSLPTIFIAAILQCNVLHARGYPAALLAEITAMVIGVKVVFDPRGQYPDEMVMNGIWREGSLTHRSWLRLEDWLIRTAGAVIGVTPEYRDEFKQRGAKRAFFVPNRADTTRFRESAPVQSIKGSLHATKKDCELLFIGELHSVWNDPTLVTKHFIALQKQFPQARLRMITRANPAPAQTILKRMGVDLQRVRFETHPPDEMPKAMHNATFGLIFRAVKVHSLWPVKMAEYLAAGIPLIVDESLGGLPRKIVQKRRLGVVLNPEHPIDYAVLKEVLDDWEVWSMRCKDYAMRCLDIRSTSKQYIRIYRQI